MDLFNAYAVDEELENNGVWTPVGGGSEFLIARSGNDAYAKLLTRLIDQDRKTIDLGGAIAEAKSNEIMIAVLAESVIRGWRTKIGAQVNPTITFQGEELPYTPANAVKILSDSRMKDLRKAVIVASENVESYKLKLEAQQGEA
jgi:hypothetical protein